MISEKSPIHQIRYAIAGMNVSYKVGQGVSGGEKVITRIVRNEESFYNFGKMRYEIYARYKDDDVDFMFKYVEEVPVEITVKRPEDDQEDQTK